jgi:hypothetical protein
VLFGDLGVLGDEQRDGGSGEAAASAGGEQRVAGLTFPFLYPNPERCGGLGGQRRAPLLASLAQASNVRPGAELHVLAAESGEF